MIWGRLRHALATPQALTSRPGVVKKQDGTNRSEFFAAAKLRPAAEISCEEHFPDGH